jgi:CubicO group peptidase (beta-lactamase class C family)
MPQPFASRWVPLALILSGALTAIQVPAAGQRRADTLLIQDLDVFIQRAMATNLSPGLGVAVVRGDDIVYANGFGVADRERGVRATADTQFYIASTTKSFTALAGSLLAARGELDLDATLARALPGARLHPEVSGDAITIRHLLTHTHGLAPNGPVVVRTAFSGEFTNEQLLDVLRFHGPTSTGRAFNYSNLGYNVFGLVIDAKNTEGWKQVIQREVLDPLGMRSTTSWISKTDATRLAQPYEVRSGNAARVEYLKRDENMQAAGGHVSTANDLARYLVAHINGGRIDGRQTLPEAAVTATHRLQVEQDRDFGSFHRVGWGLGWDIATYDGDRVLQRFGGFEGFFSHLSFMPERKVGVVVLANGGGAGGLISDIVATYAYDRALEKPGLAQRTEERWAAFTKGMAQREAAIAKDRATRQARSQKTPLPLDAYVGAYESPALGRMVWTLENGRLKVQMGIARGDVEVYDSARNQLRIEITGGGSVVTFLDEPGAPRPARFEWLGHEFLRVP